MKTIKLLSLAMLVSVAFTSCSDDDDPIAVNEEEVITKMTITLTPNGGGAVVILESDDPDGDGPGAPIITGGTLLANTVYTGSIEVLDESDPADVEDITEEVAEEDDEHQFFFAQVGGIGTTEYLDFDGDGNPLGLEFRLTTGAATTGQFIVILRHEPNKDAAGVSDGDIANAGGETDIEATFPITFN